MQIGQPCLLPFPGESVCGGECPVLLQGTAAPCAWSCVKPDHVHCVKSVLAKPSPLQRQQNCHVLLFIDRVEMTP